MAHVGHERTVRLLEARLELLASIGERCPATERRFDAHVDAVAEATQRAIELEVLTPAEAAAVWATVAGRHPNALWCADHPRAA